MENIVILKIYSTVEPRLSETRLTKVPYYPKWIVGKLYTLCHQRQEYVDALVCACVLETWHNSVSHRPISVCKMSGILMYFHVELDSSDGRKIWHLNIQDQTIWALWKQLYRCISPFYMYVYIYIYIYIYISAFGDTRAYFQLHANGKQDFFEGVCRLTTGPYIC
jgi:hypothetical protein